MDILIVCWFVQVRETVRDVVFLHNELFFAAAQKKYTCFILFFNVSMNSKFVCSKRIGVRSYRECIINYIWCLISFGTFVRIRDFELIEFFVSGTRGLFWSESYLNFHCWLYWISLELDQSNWSFCMRSFEGKTNHVQNWLVIFLI